MILRSGSKLGGESKSKRKSLDKPTMPSRAVEIDSSRVADLNDALGRVVEIYPDRDKVLCRQALMDVPDHKPLLEAAADALADPEGSRTRNHTDDNNPPAQALEPWQRFRTQSYKTAVSKILRREFSKLKPSTITAVLNQNNHDYARSRASLVQKASRSWRVSILSFFSRKLGLGPQGDGAAGGGGGGPATGCAELDDEIMALHGEARRQTQIDEDAQLARRLNEEEYGGTLPFECECCFGDFVWEDICYCEDLHFFCRECLRRSVSGTLYGGLRASGSSGLMDTETGRVSIRCISSATGATGCTAIVSPSYIPYFLPPEIVRALDDYIAKVALDQSEVLLDRCPFCTYAVVTGRVLPARWDGTVSGAVVWVWVQWWWWLASWMPSGVQREVEKRVVRVDRKPWETMLRCQNPECGRDSCLRCKREWKGVHDCAKDQADSKQAHIALRMDEALKRTCPKCRTSFLKDGGCNSMRCVCGYKMCYLCRTDITNTGYIHFCNHFRPIPGMPCQACRRCLLYENEVEDRVLREARISAEREWESLGRRGRLPLPGPAEESTPGSRLGGWNLALFKIWCFCTGYSR